MTNSNTNVTPINQALRAVKTRFVRVPSSTAYPRFRDVITGIEQADAVILLDWYRKNSNPNTPQKSASELLDSLKWVYGDGFLPNGPVVLSGDLQNLWKAPTLKPSGATVTAADVQPFVEFLERWFPVDSERHYFLWWIAHTVRRPESRIVTTPVLRSEHGVGKGFFAETLMSTLLGRSSVAVTSLKDVTGDFNDVIEGKTFILIDEVYKSKKSTTDALKGFQGNGTLPLRRKHKPTVTIDNFINFALTSNDHLPLVIEDGDRRFWVPEYIKHRESQVETDCFINKTLKPWLLSGGFQLVRDYLEGVNLAAYRPTEAPRTAAKDCVSGYGQKDNLPGVIAEVVLKGEYLVVTVNVVKHLLRDVPDAPADPSDVAIAEALLGLGYIQKRATTARYYITQLGVASGLSTSSPPKALASHVPLVDQFRPRFMTG